MRSRNPRMKSVTTVIFIGILLFNYVNSTMFWHTHIVDGRIVEHSHIYGESHTTGNSDGGHTPGQLKLLDLVSHILCTDTVIPDIQIERIDILEYVIFENPVAEVPASVVFHSSLRGPPVC